MNIRSILRQPVLTVAFHTRDVRWTLGGRGVIRDNGRTPLPAGTIVDGVIEDPETAGKILRESPGFPGRPRMQVALALPAQRTVFRTLELPLVPGRQFDEMVAREIRRELPMMADNAYISWKRVPDRGNKGVAFVVAAARDVMDSHGAALRAAGLQPQSADLRVIAAARAIGEADCVVADVEEDEVEIAIFREGLPSIVRHVEMAQGAGDIEWGRQLAEELARTLKFYRDTHRDDAVAAQLPISFVGDAARKAMLSPDIAEQTGHSVAMPPLLLVVTPEQDTVGFAANLGLALKDIAA